MIRIIKEIDETVRLANRITAQAGDGPRWTLFLTNRSFIAQVFSLTFAALALFGVPLPIPAEVAANAVYGAISAGMMIWAGAERLYGKTRVIWSREQARDAAAEADALSRALREVGAR